MSSACVCHIDGEWCFYCEVYSPVEDENVRLKAELKEESLRAAEWEGEARGYAEETERLKSALSELLAAINRGDLQRTKMSSGLDYVIYNAKEALKDAAS
ncbi:hypothetical protein D3C71_1671510 [compost metagenome]